jgi:hypothetical protein
MQLGWIPLHREIADHDLWLCEPFTKGQAWVDLLILANHKPGTIVVRGIEIHLEVGQVGWSEVALSKRWKWSRNKVRRYIDSLRRRKMAIQQTDNKTSVITILNYKQYNQCETANDTTGETSNETPDGQQTDTNNNGKKKRSISKKTTSSFVEGSVELRLAIYLFNCIRVNSPTHKEPNLQTWAKHIDYMIRIDKRDADEIKNIIKWCQEDNHPDGNGFCWARNILSTEKLRKQYDQLVMRMGKDEGDWIPPELRGE